MIFFCITFTFPDMFTFYPVYVFPTPTCLPSPLFGASHFPNPPCNEICVSDYEHIRRLAIEFWVVFNNSGLSDFLNNQER